MSPNVVPKLIEININGIKINNINIIIPIVTPLLNDLLNMKVTIKYNGEIKCIACDKKIYKTYNP